jgi:ABC-type antimicrobial peptide transport system permease subunit
VLIGSVIGLAGALAVRKLMARGLLGLSGPGVWAMAPAVLLLVVAAACACYFPARRAAATPPAAALRLE